MEIDGVGELVVFLGCRAVATPESVGLAAIDAPGARRQREEILVHAVGADGAEAVIEEVALVIVDIAGVGLPAEKMPRQFHHVVGTAAFLVAVGGLVFLRQAGGI